jgi:hypothetical protein
VRRFHKVTGSAKPLADAVKLVKDVHPLFVDKCGPPEQQTTEWHGM